MTLSAWRTPATLSLLALLCGCDNGAEARAPQATPRPFALTVVAPPLTPGLECLRADSLRIQGDTLRYTNLWVHEETGDELGKELRLMHHDGTWTGTIAVAEGVLGKAIPFRAVSLDPATGNLTLAWDFNERQASFQGRLSCRSIIGALRWDTNDDVETDTLKREPSLR